VIRRVLFAIVVAVLTLGAPRAALACPVCFGNSDAPMAIATNTGIIFMLGIVGAVLCGFASFFIYLMRRAKRAATQEGTAQC
jgi:heme/copper-type cytochrome/quinol oxidase subunit 2